MDKIAKGYFEKFFLTSGSRRVQEIMECVEARITSKDTMRLMQPITDEELRQTMFQIPTDNSPSPNGFTGRFHQEYWDVVGCDIVDMVKLFWFSRNNS